MGERTDPLSREHESTADIRRDIAATQREMSHTIDEIQYRLSPAHIKEQARESVRRAGVRTKRGTIDRVKANPLGAALVGAGLYLLMRDNDHERYDVAFDADFDRGMDRGRDLYAEPGVYAGNRYSSSSEYRDLDFEDGEGRMSEMKDRAREAVGDLRDRASGAAETAADRARMLRYRASSRARTARMQSRDMLMDNPFVGGLAAAALGAIIGSMIPETEREHELMGEASDRMLDRVGTAASSVAGKVTHVATAVASAAKDAATETARRETKNAKNEMQNELGSI